jgi:hypothetical protein
MQPALWRALSRRRLAGTTQTLSKQGLGAHHVGELARLHRGRELQLPVQQRLVARLALHHLPWHLRPVPKRGVSTGVRAHFACRVAPAPLSQMRPFTDTRKDSRTSE